MLEDSLREMFTAQVESTPSTGDAATRAISRGRRIRRIRTVLSSTTAAMALVVTVGGVSFVGGWWPPAAGLPGGTAVGFNAVPGETSPAGSTRSDPAPVTVPANGIGLDLRVGDRLWTSDGREHHLGGVGEVHRIYQVPTGWVYGGATAVRFLRPDGSSISLSGQDDRWVVSPDGQRLAFVIDTVLYVANLRATGLAVLHSLDVPPAAEPTAFVGDRVAIAVQGQGFDVLDPAAASSPAWNPRVVAIYGGRGRNATGLIRPEGGGSGGASGLCVADLERTGAGLRPEAIGGCALGVPVDEPAPRLAPDGGWLAVPSSSEVSLVNVARVVRGEDAVVPCPVRSTAAPVWLDARTVVVTDGHGLTRCRTDGSRQDVPLPEGIGAGWELVPKMVAPPDTR